MARTRKEVSITTRNARRQLAPRKKPYCRSLGPNSAIGYQKKVQGGVWKAIESLGNKRYREALLALADDLLPADGLKIHDFEQAKKAAVAKIASWHANDRASNDGPETTVRSSVMTYIQTQEARERTWQGRGRVRGDARLRLSKHVLADEIAEIVLFSLTETHLTNWRSRLQPGLSGSTVRRIVNDLKAALNLAAKTDRARLPADISTIIKHGLAAVEATPPTARDNAALVDADVRRIIEATKAIDTEAGWDGDLLRIVVVLAATGARFSQVSRTTVADVQVQGRLMVPTSHKGKGTKKTTHTGIRVGADVIQVLRPAIAGKRAGDPLLERWRHKQVKGSETQLPRWVRSTRGPWNAASELARPWAEIVSRAGLSSDVVPYALRHSSIVRQLRAGLPVRLVAAVHDTSTAMIERHYASAIVDMLDDLSAAAVIPLMANADANFEA